MSDYPWNEKNKISAWLSSLYNPFKQTWNFKHYDFLLPLGIKGLIGLHRCLKSASNNLDVWMRWYTLSLNKFNFEYFNKQLHISHNLYSIKQAWKSGKFRETIHRYRACTACRNDETNFRFPQQILAETIRKRR